MPPVFELVSTGSELLSGRTVNRHAQVLGHQLHATGLELSRDTTIPDEPAIMRDAVAAAMSRSRVLFISGGLGPTEDDITVDVVADLLNRNVVEDEASIRKIRERCQLSGRVFTPAQARQARIIDGAIALSNRVGYAPGQRIDVDERHTLVLLPGPPREFNAILEDHVVPWLKTQVADPGVREEILMTGGVPEADIVTLMGEYSLPPPGVKAAYCAAPGRVEIRLRSSDGKALDGCIGQLKQLLGAHVFADERMELVEALARILLEQNKTIAVAESCTGGMIGAELTSVAGSSRYFEGGVICYSNEVKRQLLGVRKETLDKYGAVSAETVMEMAQGVRRKLGTHLGLAVTGIAGPSGGTEEKPVGLVYIGLADEERVVYRRHTFAGQRESIRIRTSLTALDFVRRFCIGALDDE